MTDAPLEQTTDAAAKPVPATIPMPDHEIRQARWYQLYVRLARPTLDWITNASVLWTMILQPWLFQRFDIPAAGLALGWAGTVYGLKTFEKTKGVA